MTTQSTDEDILIKAARAERGKHRSGASMVAMLCIAAIFGAAGCLLVFLPHVVGMLLPGPLAVLSGLSLAIFVTVGVVAFLIAGFFLLAAFASSPLASWGSAVRGNCPTCGEPHLRSDTVEGPAGAEGSAPPRGIVTLCETQGCGYAQARVIRASRAAAA